MQSLSNNHREPRRSSSWYTTIFSEWLPLTRNRFLFAALAYVFYVVLFLPVPRIAGGAQGQGAIAVSLAIIPIAITGWLLGRFAGVLMALFCLASAVLLLFVVGDTKLFRNMPSYVPGYLVLFVVGYIAGWIGEQVAKTNALAEQVRLEQQTLEAQVLERQRAEQELRASEERYRDLFENANDLMQSIGADGNFIYVNAAWKQALGYNDEEIKRLRFLDVVHPDARADALEVFGRVMAGENVTDIETALLTRDGHKVLIEGSATPRMVDGSVISTRGIFRDVTERRLAEQRATFQNALLGAQYEVSPDGILVVGKNDEVLSFNQRFAEMWHIPAEAFADGTTESLRQAVSENIVDVEGWLKRTGEIYMSRETSSNDEIAFKDGRLFDRYSAPINSPDGAYLGRVWFFNDVTKRKRAEEQVQKQNAYLNALQETSLGLMQRLDVNALLQDIVARAGALVGTENGYVFLRDADFDEMELRVGVGAYEGFVGRRTKSGVGLAGQVWETNAPIVVDDYRIWPSRLADPSRDILRAVVGVPLRSEKDVIGVIGLAYLDDTRKFGDAEIQVLQRFAQLAAIALDNARLYEQAQASLDGEQQQRRLADALAHAAGKLSSTLIESDMRQVILDEINDLLQPDQINLYERIGDEQGLRFERHKFDEAEERFDDYQINDLISANTRSDLWRVFSEGAPLYEDSAAVDGYLREHYCLPWFAGESVAGVVEIYHTAKYVTIRPKEQAMCQAIVQQTGIAIENARLFVRTQQEIAERTRAEAALAQELRESELLNLVTSHAVSLDADKALIEICRDLAEYFGVEQSGIALLSDDKQSLTVVADHSPEGTPSVVGYVIPVQGNPSTEIVLETRQPAAFADAQNDPRLAAIHDLMKTRGAASILIAPLFVRDEIIGTLGIDTYTPREFSDYDITLVQRVAISISTALESARLYRAAQQELAERRRVEQEIRQRNTELEVISRVSAVMTTNIDLIAALETLARELVRTFRARNCGIALLNETKTELTVVADALSQEHEEHAVGIVIPLEGNLSSQYVVYNQRSLVIPDAQTDPMTAPIHERMRQRRTKCLAIIPLMSGGKVIGTIGLDTTDPDHIFGEEEIRLAETMANQMANAIEKQRLFDQTKERARREQMTREIGANLTRSLDMETILQTMARQLSHALGASHAVVRLGAQDKESNGGNEHS